MIIPNGYIRFRKPTERKMGADGYPIPSAEEWSEPIACQCLPSTNLRAQTNGEPYTQHNHTLLIERMEPVSEVIKLYNERGEVGQFSIRAYEHLDAVCQTKILL